MKGHLLFRLAKFFKILYMYSISSAPAHMDRFFYHRQKIGVKIASCALTFGPIKSRSYPPDNLSAKKSVGFR